jgi:3-hydroxy-3-methylglutaryl CoA synthase
MAVGTHKSNATTHPGKVLASSRKQRQTRRQMEENKGRTKATAIVVEENAILKCREVVSQVADTMDSLKRDEKAI